jgi:hypothetical protein
MQLAGCAYRQTHGSASLKQTHGLDSDVYGVTLIREQTVVISIKQVQLIVTRHQLATTNGMGKCINRPMVHLGTCRGLI